MPTRFRKEDLSRLGRLLQQHRVEAGMSLRSLVALSGISAGAIRALEAGRSNPSLGTVLAVVEALGLSLDRLVHSVRGNRPRVAVVTRSGQDRPGEGLTDAVLSAGIATLDAGQLRRSDGVTAQHPVFGMVLEGEVLATTAGGDRVRLAAGDSYHAQPAQLQALASGGEGPARLLQVVDLRPDRGRPMARHGRGATSATPSASGQGIDHRRPDALAGRDGRSDSGRGAGGPPPPRRQTPQA